MAPGAGEAARTRHVHGGPTGEWLLGQAGCQAGATEPAGWAAPAGATLGVMAPTGAMASLAQMLGVKPQELSSPALPPRCRQLSGAPGLLLAVSAGHGARYAPGEPEGLCAPARGLSSLQPAAKTT